MLSGCTLSACAMAGTAVLRIVVSNDSMKKPTAISHGSRRLAVSLRTIFSRDCKRLLAGSGARERRIDDVLRLGDQFVQVVLVVEALGIDLVDIFSPRGPPGEPTAARDDLDAADGCRIARRVGQNCIDGLAGEFRDPHLSGVELAEPLFLFRIGRGVLLI